MGGSFKKWWRQTPNQDRSAIFTFAIIFGGLMLFILGITFFQSLGAQI